MTNDILALEQALYALNSTDTSISTNTSFYNNASINTNTSTSEQIMPSIEKDGVINITVGPWRLADV